MLATRRHHGTRQSKRKSKQLPQGAAPKEKPDAAVGADVAAAAAALLAPKEKPDPAACALLKLEEAIVVDAAAVTAVTDAPKPVAVDAGACKALLPACASVPADWLLPPNEKPPAADLPPLVLAGAPPGTTLLPSAAADESALFAAPKATAAVLP
jgi:hypothetical protein